MLWVVVISAYIFGSLGPRLTLLKDEGEPGTEAMLLLFLGGGGGGGGDTYYLGRPLITLGSLLHNYTQHFQSIILSVIS